MTTLFERRPTPPTPTPQPDEHRAGGHGHSWMMIACCIPMILIAVVLVATGIASPGFLFVGFGCLAMMAAMMYMMDDSGSRSR